MNIFHKDYIMYFKIKGCLFIIVIVAVDPYE